MSDPAEPLSAEEERREAISDDRAWHSGYLAGRAAAMKSAPATGQDQHFDRLEGLVVTHHPATDNEGITATVWYTADCGHRHLSDDGMVHVKCPDGAAPATEDEVAVLAAAAERRISAHCTGGDGASWTCPECMPLRVALDRYYAFGVHAKTAPLDVERLDDPWLADIVRCGEAALARWQEAHRNEETLALTFVGPDGPFYEGIRSVVERLRDYHSARTRAALSESPVSAPAIDAAHLGRQREWSTATFGPGPRTAGVLDHIRKELREIEAEPASLEWIDVVILALDGAWRAGHEPQAIIDAIRAKQARNEARTWPDWRGRSEHEAIEHDRSGESPVSAPEPTSEYGRLLAQRDRLIAAGADPADLLVPDEPTEP